MFALVLTILLALFVPPYVNLKRFRATLESSLGRALQRRVTIGSANLRLLPRPGFDFSGFTVYDDPTLSNEPMLRADGVTASLRLTSLWRGRLEIASLSLRGVSLNVVRAADGRWNVEGLLARASQVPTAPTALPRAEQRPRFPYIEAEDGRINFKLGQEKKAFTLVDAEFSVWLAQEDEWHLRLNARPVRTDFNLSDTGRFRLSGTVRRAASFRDTPLDLRLSLERAQLGQLTTLVYDRDRGWRGTTNATAVLAGTPAKLQIVLDAGIDDFRRYDIVTPGSYALRARCTADYSVDSARLSGILCTLPAGDGQVALRGEILHPFADRQYDLSIAAKDIAMQELVRFAQHAKRDLPLDLAADGDLDAAFTFQTHPRDPSRLQSWIGGGSTNGLVLRSRTLGPALELGAIKFNIQPALNGKARRPLPASPPPPLQLVLAPIAVDLGARAPATVRGVVTRADYAFAVQGDADLARLLNVAQGLGIPAPQRTLAGAAHLDLEIRGAWAGFGAPLPVGNVQIKNATLNLPAANAPLRVSSALVSLAPDQSSINLVSAAFEGVRGAFDGSIQLPRRCDLGPQCLVRFDLRADELTTDELNRLFNPNLRKRAWYQLFSGGGPSGLRKLHAEGHISAGRLQIKTLLANRASADVKLADGRLELSNARADLLSGKHQGRWLADFNGTPSYSGSGRLEGASLAQVSALMHDNWAAGTAQISYQVNLAGWSAADLVESLTAKLDFQWRDGILRHLAVRGAEPLRFSRFHGHAELDDGKLTFSNSSIESASGIYQLDGKASLGRELQVKLTPKSGPVIAIDGTLQKPHIAARPAASPVALKQ